MAYYTYEVLTALNCDGPKCGRQFGVVPGRRTGARVLETERQAKEIGWTIWVGRNRYHYCPKCSERYPTARSRPNMRQET